ncbi:autotransporter outer membrane beta-barrel domain-containing protein [Pantoea sp. MBD-2R]|uniref:autotransporter outer membrane beta-barrel domain-containing protein n=1 Tax=Pantoea sp. MBD-2R TaxID=3141540 RepID=UPI003183D24B
MFKLHPLFISLIAAQGLMFPAVQAATLKPFSPGANDNRVGVFCVCNGSTQTLSGIQQFDAGIGGFENATLGAKRWSGGLDFTLLGAARLDLGPQNSTVSVYDFDTSSIIYVPVFNSANITALTPVGNDTVVPDYYSSGNQQYINTRVAQVSNGTINVDIGEEDALTTAATNGWSMAAKQSQLFVATGSGQINWGSNNRINFTAGTVPYGGPYLNYAVNNVVSYKGTFTVTTRDDATTSFTVTNVSQLKAYNDWLIEQLSNGNLNASSYNEEFNKAVSITSGDIVYQMKDQPYDEKMSEQMGELVVLSADGPKARVTVEAGKTLEVINANDTAVRANNGATAIINGKVSSTGATYTLNDALQLLNASTGINNGVINGGFLNNADGTGVDTSVRGYNNTAIVDYSDKTVLVQGTSRFTNNGVINYQPAKSQPVSETAAVWLESGGFINNGNINLGVADLTGGRSSSAVRLTTDDSSFINGTNGIIYLGRTPQNSVTDDTSNVVLNQTDGSYGVKINGNGSVKNNGQIVIGSRVQNSTAIQVTDGALAQVLNNGVIDVNGRALLEPEENIAMAVIDSGSGGRVGNSGTINLNGDNATGIKVISSNTSSNAWSDGTINVNGGTSLAPSRGAVVSGGEATFTQDGILNLNGEYATGAIAQDGGTIVIGNTSSLTFNNANQTGYQAKGYSSTLVSNGANVDVSTAGSTLYQLDGGTLSTLFAGDVTLSGANSTGIIANSGYATLADRFTVTGEGAAAVKALNGAQVDVNSPVVLSGDNTVGAWGDANYSYISNNSTVSGEGNNTTGFEVGYILSNRGNIALTGANSTAVSLHDGGTIFNRGSISTTSGTGIYAGTGNNQYFFDGGQLSATGANSTAIRVGENGGLTLFGEGIFRNGIFAYDGADAVVLDKDASLTINDTSLYVYGGGDGIDNSAGASNISLSGMSIYVGGSGSAIRSSTSLPGGGAFIEVHDGGTGVTFANADGSTSDKDFVVGSGYAILAMYGSTGIRGNTTGRVISEGNIYIGTEDGGSAIVTSTASQVVNRGDIYSYSTVSPVIDLRGGSTVFINEGTLGAESPDILLVAGGATSDQIALLAGSVTGDVNTGEGTDTVALTGGTLDGSVTMGSGVDNQAYVENVSLANVSHITTAGGEGSTLDLSKISASGGSFASDDLSRGVNLGAGWSTINFLNTDWTLTDNLKLAHSTINIDGTSTLYAGNGVSPLLSGATDDSLTVNNYGTLDLTNGTGLPGDTLTIEGSLASFGGSLRLNSDLNGGGALSSQRSDTLRVTGDANGTTFIEVLPAAASSGTLSDSNLNSITDANEGISLAQVAGNAGADSFALKGGYLAAGPWSYGLYSFAPGSSDAAQRQVAGTGNAFWDYRLANSLVCENGAACQAGSESRAAVVPQVPSYISAPVGLAYYTAAILGDLQQRLGELRHQQGGPAGDGGEMFLRYSGSNLRYQTSQNFKDFGYNVDLDYSALQVGGNVLRLDGDGQSLRGGVAYTRGNTRLRPDAADGYSSTTFDSDSLALYGTWLRDSGLYLDGTLSYSWHRGETDIARQKEVAKIKGKGWTASLQSGYPFELGSGVRLEPQAQLMYLHLGLDNFTDKENLTVKYDDYNQTVGRVGAKLDRSWRDDGGRQYTPYVQANYFKGWGGKAKTTVGAEGVDNLDHTFNSGRFGQMWEVGVGGTTTFRNDVSLYAQADYRKEIDSNGAKGWGYTAGVRWTF